MKRTFIIIFILVDFSSCKFHSRHWTDVYYQVMYSHLYELNGKFMKNDNQRRQFTNYEIDRLKIELPDGFSSIPDDSLQRLCARIGKEYNKTHNTENLQMTVPWTPEGEATFKETILSGSFIKSIDKILRNKYCDCMIVGFKKRRSDSISIPVPDSVYENIIHECNIKLSVNAK